MAARYDFKDFSVLVADDSRQMRSLLRSVLRSLNVGRIVEAEDGGEALDRLVREPFDLATFDWEMTPVDGLTAVRTLRTSDDGPNHRIPVFMITGHAQPERVVAARDAGIHAFLAKPLKAELLIGRLIAAIERPRSFVRTETYAGPDRRRRQAPHYAGPERRRSSARGSEGTSRGRGGPDRYHSEA